MNFVDVSTTDRIRLVESLAREIWTEHYTPIIGTGQVEYMLARFQSAPAIAGQIAEGYLYYVMMDGTKPVGYLAMQPRGGELFLSKIYVVASLRRLGFGRQAVAFAEELARKRGLRKIVLTVNRNNSSSIAAYERTGFRRTRELVQDIGNGFVMDDYQYEKAVEPGGETMTHNRTMQRSEVALSGTRLTVWTGGRGPALLLLHSAWGDAEMSWGPVWNLLAEHFAVIAPDLPGFGSSDPLGSPSLAGNALLLKQLLESRNAGRAVVAGNSFGACVAIEFSTLYPEQTRSLVIVNGGFLPGIPGFVRRLFSVGFVERRLRGLMKRMNYSDKAFAKAFPNPDKLPAGFFERIRRNEESQARTVFDTFRNQAEPQQTPRVPVSIIWGTGDRLATMKQLGLVRTWPAEPVFLALNGAGHMPQLEQPEEFAARLRQTAGG